MVELIGDVCIPSELIVPVKETTSLPTAPREGTVFFDSDTNKLVFYNGTSYETITSA